MSAVLVAALSYLLGSVVMGVLYSRARGADIRERDLPGGSGTYRQYGTAAAALVTLGDILKGVLAALLARALAPDATWVAPLFVVLGHCYPVFHAFRGGGGIAPLIGALTVLAPTALLGMLASAAVVIPLYRATLQKRLKLNAVPFATAVAVPLGLFLAAGTGGLSDLLAGAAAMAVRALHLLATPKAAPPKRAGPA